MAPYRAEPKAREWEQQQNDRLLESKLIEPTQTEWVSLVVFMAEKDGTIHFCVGYRGINCVTVRNSYVLQRIDENIAWSGKDQVFLTLHVTSSY